MYMYVCIYMYVYVYIYILTTEPQASKHRKVRLFIYKSFLQHRISKHTVI
jgi:hypothetical protein